MSGRFVGRHEHADAPHPLALLRARQERPGRRRAAKERDGEIERWGKVIAGTGIKIK
jgi:hypothetical protein